MIRPGPQVGAPCRLPAGGAVFGLLTGVRSRLDGHRGRRLAGPRDGATRPACGGRGARLRETKGYAVALTRMSRPGSGRGMGMPGQPMTSSEGGSVGSVIKKRRKRMAKKKHRKLLRKTRVQRRNKK